MNKADELLAAVDRLSTGETILLADGQYKLPRPVVLDQKQNVILRSASGEASKVTLVGKGWEHGDEHDDLLRISRCEGVTIADLSFADCRSYGIKVEAEHAPKDVNILNCHFRDIGVRAIKGSAAQNSDLRAVKGSVRGCYFENTKTPPADWLFGGDYIAAIDMMALEDWTFSDNVFRNIKGRNGGGRAAIFIWVRSRKVVVERNLIVNCDRGVAFGNPGKSTANVAGERLMYVSDGIIRNNFIAGGSDCGIELWYADRIRVFNNSIWRPEQNWNRGIRIGAGTANTEVANNLVHGGIQLEGGEAQVHHNLAGRLNGFFEDPASGNLELTPAATPALDQGVPLAEVTEDIRRRPRTGNPDLGAWDSKAANGPNEAAAPDFGPNVLVFDSTMTNIQSRIDAIFSQQERSQFGSNRYAYLCIDESGRYFVMVPGFNTNGTQGTTWSTGKETATPIPIERFHLAHPEVDTTATINEALSSGKNLLLTPGIYHLENCIRITRPGTVVLGLGYPTLLVDNGTLALAISDVDGVKVGGILFEAGAANSDTMVQVGEHGSKTSHAADPVFLWDIFCRVGGAQAGKSTCMVTINSHNVVGDNFWLWRADHGRGVGWNSNPNQHGLIVNADNVTLYGLFVEHTQDYQTVWNGNGGRVYDGRGATIDVRHQQDTCVTINASNVVLRGFILRGAGTTNLVPKRIIGAIRIEGGQDIVIEDCDISDWGRLNPATGYGFDYDAAIFSRSATLKRLIVQRCKLHHPTFDGSTWYEPKYPTHTQGPQCITLFNTGGNHVIRYNECFSDLDHMYNDGIGGGSNGSFQYVFHNTLFGPDEWLPRGGVGGDRIVKHTISRNNILHVRGPSDWSASNHAHNVDNDFDYDLFNGRVPSSQEAHGVRGEPVYAEGSGFDLQTKTGHFQLASDSPGAGVGQAIPNFSDDYNGKAPDVGAHQRGTPPTRYGVRATEP